MGQQCVPLVFLNVFLAPSAAPHFVPVCVFVGLALLSPRRHGCTQEMNLDLTKFSSCLVCMSMFSALIVTASQQVVPCNSKVLLKKTVFDASIVSPNSCYLLIFHFHPILASSHSFKLLSVFSSKVIMEIVSAVNETISLFGAVSELCHSVSQRVDNFKGNPDELQVVKEELTYAKDKINVCKTTLEEHRQAITSGSFKFELIELQRISKMLQRSMNSVKELEQKLQQRRGLKRFFRANKIADDITQQMDNVRNMTSHVHVMHEKLNEIAQQNDLFTPNFSTIPKVLGPVHLNFSTTETKEGQLKAKFLESVERSTGNVDDIQANVTAVVGVAGMGGVGKTTALLGLARDQDVRNIFASGGIYFLVVGKDATETNLVAKLKDFVRCSGGKKRCENIDLNGLLEIAVRETSAWFAKRKALFICDDLWQTQTCETGYFGALMGLLDASPESHMLLSTRFSSIASESYASILFAPRANTGPEARGIFLKSAGLDETTVYEDKDAYEEQVRQVLELCGGIPLMLSIAGAQVRRRRGTAKASLQRLLNAMNDERSFLQEKRYGQYPLCFNQAVESSLKNIAEILESSDGFMNGWVEYSRSNVTRLESSVCDFVIDCFLRLCVLPRSARVSKEIILGAWPVTESANSLIDYLVEFHLLLEFEDAQGTLTFGLHDTILDYCENISQSGPDAMYKTYHGQFLSRAWKLCHQDLHQESLSESDAESKFDDLKEDVDIFWDPEAYAKSRPWWRILLCLNECSEIGKYLLGNIFRHLRESGRLAEAVGLLSHMGWTRLRVVHGGILALNGEFSLVKSEIESYHVEQRDKKESGDVVLEITRIWDMIRRAWPILLRHSKALSTHAYGYLLDKKENMPMVQRYLDSTVDIMSGPWLKPENAFWSKLDSSSDERVFHTGEHIVDIALVTKTKNVIIATHKALFWIEMDTMRTTREVTIRNVKENESRISGLAYCEAKGIIVLQFSTNELEIRNEKSGNVLKTMSIAHDDSVRWVAISSDGRTIVSGSRDNTVRVWSTDTGTPVGQPLRGHDGSVRCVAISSDGRTIVSGSEDKSVRVWNTDTGTPVGQPLHGHDGSVKCVAISSDGRTIVYGSEDKSVRVWNTDTSTPVGQPLRGHDDVVYCVAISSDGRTIVSGSRDNTVRVWNTDTGTPVGQPLRGHDGMVYLVAISADGRTIVSGSEDKSVRVWNTDNSTPVGQPLHGHDGSVRCVAISSDGRKIVYGSEDKSVRVWNTDTSTPVGQPLRGHGHPVFCVAISVDGRTIVSGSLDMSVRVWNTDTSTPVGQPLRGHDSWVECVAISADGRTIVSGSDDNTVRVWNTHTGTPVGQPLRGHDSWVSCVAISSDALTIVSGSRDNTVIVWNTDTGTPVGQPLRGHDNLVCCVAISSDAQTIVSGSWDDTVRVWNTDTGTPVGQPLRGHDDWVSCVAISADGRTIVSGSFDNTVRVWCAGNRVVVESLSDSSQSPNMPIGWSDNKIVSASMENSMSTQQPQRTQTYRNCFTAVLPNRARHVVYNDFTIREGQRPRVICALGATRPISFELIEPNEEACG